MGNKKREKNEAANTTAKEEYFREKSEKSWLNKKSNFETATPYQAAKGINVNEQKKQQLEKSISTRRTYSNLKPIVKEQHHAPNLLTEQSNNSVSITSMKDLEQPLERKFP